MKALVRHIRRFVRKGLGIHADVAELRRGIDETKMLLGRMLVNQQPRHCDSLHEAEFQVFSQFGDDGIIQYLIRKVPITSRVFIEFGVEDYTESNTRFLLIANNWKGLVIDGSDENIRCIKKDDIYWRHDLAAVSSFVTVDNINQIFAQQGFEGDIGLLSIDIDGNDYHVWEAIHAVKPAIVVVEYNSVLGPAHAVTIPYDPAFSRMRAHHSGLYWGASIRALCLLAEKKGYAFVGSNSAGNNAYFVRSDGLGDLKRLAPEEGYVESRTREARDANGRLTFTGGGDRIGLIQDMPVYDVERGEVLKIRDLKIDRFSH